MSHDPGLVACACMTTHPRRGAMLRDAVHAYDLQAYPDRLLVVVNDGAPLRAARRDVVVIDAPPGTPIGTKRNLALAEALRRGAGWLATWDDDDFALPGHLARLVHAASAGGNPFALAAETALARGRLEDVVAVTTHPCPTTFVGRVREVVAAGGYPPISYLEDGALFAKLRRGSAWVPGLAFVHRRHARNVSGAGGGRAHHLDEHVAMVEAPDARCVAFGREVARLLALPRRTLVRAAT